MFKVDEIKSLIEALDSSSLEELELEQENGKLVLKKNNGQVAVPLEQPTAAVQKAPAAAPAPAAQPEEKVESKEPEANADGRDLFTVTSPMVGTFYAAPSPDADPYVRTGDSVEEDTVVCIVEAMKLMNPIVADTKGKIVEIVAENGELVEYGQPLMVVERNK
ncbi:acetyl-CoA carboxylase biotin carboxyl carrier protein [Shouchella clausii]|jgi:acetyl-CoA carboxylase biotin carboxyl carrier protein|uniref:Biotin carboxyl carrier protein of acetyl-CoA carboxylase n=1 Tax=Shouchella clausii TaxID=79880 RepID=A0A268S0D6_SHOCL|nr:acetyl-CoA carboxylase biotin carboxyl carrier protein [Shouchella clausii]PAD40908.1 acetyl-CoA carboxylase, biotin carboxyl carrier protein [Bacillus sp. 7520-S]SPU20728.1 acetyl-CoA carboxylase [Niallia circulans]AST97257.1 acetyl-CoA carboxylase, biotin carboxyl carrier protein [Shouchella clausii]MCM3547243.1 acetyl-CoA carboxylase biotin carboxyl carrier protein [Shouchella clausii]MEB5473158.1 acetyl-CoA carboxylase biotin carboxyl carrier protein [Shouchella clausii]